eukprot:2041673-Rhodomonas_salina.6
MSLARPSLTRKSVQVEDVQVKNEAQAGCLGTDSGGRVSQGRPELYHPSRITYGVCTGTECAGG